jgi:hypothetical protein
MFHAFAGSRFVWLALGLMAGLLASGLMPYAPLHAVGNATGDTFAIATGPMDEEVEAIFFLDFLTGDLRAAALNPRLGRFNAFFQFNVLQAMQIDVSKNPKFSMITGMLGIRRGASAGWGQSVVYVAESTTGRVGAFATPWDRSAANANKPMNGALRLLDIAPFRTAAVRANP